MKKQSYFLRLFFCAVILYFQKHDAIISSMNKMRKYSLKKKVCYAGKFYRGRT